MGDTQNGAHCDTSETYCKRQYRHTKRMPDEMNEFSTKTYAIIQHEFEAE